MTSPFTPATIPSAGLGGVIVSSTDTPTAGEVLTATSATAADWEPSGLAVVYDSRLTGTAASFDVSGIAGTYRHLLCYLSGRCDKNAGYAPIALTFNNDSTTGHYLWQILDGAGSVAEASSNTNAAGIRIGYLAALTGAANGQGIIVINIPDYAGTTFYKQARASGGMRQAGTTIEADVAWGEWDVTSAITRVTLAPDSGNFIAGTRLTIYGL